MAGAARAEALLAAGAGEGRGEDGATPGGMGGSESSQGGRRVSFGLDERERVRVLQGIRVRRLGVSWGRREPGCGRLRPGGEGSEVQRWKEWGSREEGRETGKAEGGGGWRSDGESGEKEGWGPGHGCCRAGARQLFIFTSKLCSQPWFSPRCSVSSFVLCEQRDALRAARRQLCPCSRCPGRASLCEQGEAGAWQRGCSWERQRGAASSPSVRN